MESCLHRERRGSRRRGGTANEENAQAVRLVHQLRAELGTDHGTINRVAEQLCYCVESVRGWVKQADIDDYEKPGVTSAEAEWDRARGRAPRPRHRGFRRGGEYWFLSQTFAPSARR